MKKIIFILSILITFISCQNDIRNIYNSDANKYVVKEVKVITSKKSRYFISIPEGYASYEKDVSFIDEASKFIVGDTVDIIFMSYNIEAKEILESIPYNVPTHEEGFYLITNIFAVPGNTIRWKDFLKNEGFEPKVFVNPKNGWDYVYVFYSGDVYLAEDARRGLEKLACFKELWVAKVNLP